MPYFVVSDFLADVPLVFFALHERVEEFFVVLVLREQAFFWVAIDHLLL